MIVKTSDPNSIKPLLNKLYIPPRDSHKGQNGKLLVIGGSKLFHAASIWSAEVASYFVDMVHYSSTAENSEVFLSLKKKFRNGIVVTRKDLPAYVEEDDVVLVGPGMVRGKTPSSKLKAQSFEEIMNLDKEEDYTYHLSRFLLKNFSDKKIVLDAGSIQMMKPEWLKGRTSRAILTPHSLEFKTLFKVDVSKMSLEEKKKVVQEKAGEYGCILLFKGPTDIVSDGKETYLVEGGNAGLTKGGSGDVLASLTASFFTKNDGLISCVLASYLVKTVAERLFLQSGYWYNTSSVIQTIPKILFELYRSARNV